MVAKGFSAQDESELRSVLGLDFRYGGELFVDAENEVRQLNGLSTRRRHARPIGA